MYQEFYGLTEKPFNLTPDPRFLYLSKKHKEAFAHLMYGIRHRSGFVMVSGEIGTGKTTICRSLLKQLDPDIEVALVFNPYLSPQELLKRINQDFGIESASSSILELIDELNTYLLDRAREGKNCVLIIDEAQDLSAEVLEQIRLLSNLETEKEKLLQIMLIGQPELAEKLEMRELRQLNQRITARYHLEPLSEEETLHYIAFRLRVAGGRKKVRFARKAVREIYKVSGGTPRVINALCDRALLIGYTRELREITPKVIKAAAKEIQGVEHIRTTQLNIASILRTGGVLSSAAVIVLFMVLATSGQLPILKPGPMAAQDGTPNQSLTPNQVDAGMLPSELDEPVEQDPLAMLEDHMEFDDAVEATEVPAEAAPEPSTAPTIEMRDVNVVEPEPSESLALVDDTSADSEASEPEVAEPAPVEEVPEPIQVASIPEPEPAPIPVVEEPVESEQRVAMREAVQAVFAMWNHTPKGAIPTNNSIDSASAYLRSNGFAVTTLSASIPQLALLNRPALLLTKQGDADHWVALTAYNSGVCTITTSTGEKQTLTTNELAAIYSNEALVPWRDATPKASPIRLLDSGERIWELQDDLLTLGLMRSEATGVYDAATEAVIRDIQRICGLEIDGIFGGQCRLALSGWLGTANTPFLSDAPYPVSTQHALLAKLPVEEAPAPTVEEAVSIPEPEEVVGPDETPETQQLPEPEPQPQPVPVESEVNVSELPEAGPTEPDYEPILPPRRGPSSDSVTEPAETIVPLKPARNFNTDDDENEEDNES